MDVRYNQEVDSIMLQRMSAMNRQQNRELWTKPVPEVKYLNTDNVSRYRLIMRFFHDNHNKLKYWLRPEDVFEGVCAWGLLEDYTLEQCQRDLEVLTEWKNLTSRHDGGRANTIEEYLRKRYRYQMTPYSIEIERMLDNLESIQGYGGSLEPTLLERIVGYVQTIRDRAGRFPAGESLQLWRDLQSAFRDLHENASDYLASLQTVRAEELMLTEQFIIYKDTLSHYLQNFMLSLQRCGAQLEGLLRTTEGQVWDTFIQHVVADELRTPSLDEDHTQVERMARKQEEWAIFAQWFAGTDTEQSDVVFLERATKDSIARLVRYALAIQEKQRLGVSRKRELDYLGQWFLRMDDLAEAHKLGAAVFGLFKPRHFQGDPVRTSDSADMSMWDEQPVERALVSRSRARRKGGSTEVVRQRSREQAEMKQAVLAQMAMEAAVLEQWVALGRFRLSELGVLSPFQRKILLSWISRCLASRSGNVRTPDGLIISLRLPEQDKRTRLEFADGELDLPDFQITVNGTGTAG